MKGNFFLFLCHGGAQKVLNYLVLFLLEYVILILKPKNNFPHNQINVIPLQLRRFR